MVVNLAKVVILHIIYNNHVSNLLKFVAFYVGCLWLRMFINGDYFMSSSSESLSKQVPAASLSVCGKSKFSDKIVCFFLHDILCVKSCFGNNKMFESKNDF